MEIMHDSFKKRRLLTILPANETAQEYRMKLAADFYLENATTAAEGLEILDAQFANLSAVLINIDLAEEDDCAFLKAMNEDRRFDTIPVVVTTSRQFEESDVVCFENGALDLFTPPYQGILTKQRIDNVIRIKRSSTFYEIESMLRELPSNIFLKDAEGRYVFSTHYWHHLDTGGDPNWTIRGKTDVEIRKDRENALKAMEADKEIIRTGKGTTYVIEINTDGVQEFMELIKRPVFDESGNVVGIIALINDVTDHELLKRELQKRALTDDLTGLNNRRSYDEFLRDIQRRDDFPIGVISADCDDLKEVNDTYGHLVGDEYLRMAALVIKQSLPDSGIAFRTGGDEFICFLPGMTEEQARETIQKMRNMGELFKIKDGSIRISYGAAVISHPDDYVYDVIARADRAMYADKSQRKHDQNRS